MTNARLHLLLFWFGVLLAVCGIAEMLLLWYVQDWGHFVYATVATFGALWWTDRMEAHRKNAIWAETESPRALLLRYNAACAKQNRAQSL